MVKPASLNALGYSSNAGADNAALSARSSHVVPTKRPPSFNIRATSCNAAGLSSTKSSTSILKARVEKFVTVHGQEISPTNYAVCQADLLIKNDRQATVHLGNSLIPHERHSKEPGNQWPEPKWRFHRMLSNPPFGVTWGGKDGYEKEARKLEKTRYKAGMPRVND